MLTFTHKRDILLTVSKKHETERSDNLMVDYIKLNKAIDNSGIKKNSIASQLNIERRTLANKLSGKSEFTVSQLDGMQRILQLSHDDLIDIFFTK